MGESLRVSPERVGVVHFVGIGGIGMSGIASILSELGYAVRGSDVAESANVLRLRNNGIEVFIGHSAENVQGASVLVVSSDIKSNNVELVTARRSGIPVVKRAEMLAEIMRLKPSIAIAGSHGKTTITSILSHVMDTCHMQPTIVCGGIIEAMGTNARVGNGDWVVVEADESDGSFIKLPATITVVTNIDPEHMSFYKDFSALLAAFQTFTENIPFYGLNVLCYDHPIVKQMSSSITDRRVLTYGLNEGADVMACDIQMSAEGCIFSIKLSGKAQTFSSQLESFYQGVSIPLIGKHNVQNCLAVIAVAIELGLELPQVFFALKSFRGVRRRFTSVGEVNGVRIVDDYAHHPVEIENVLAAGRVAAKGRVIAVMQPHRYSRLNELYKDFSACFHQADQVFVVPVYAAGEPAIPGMDHHHLAESIRLSGVENTQSVDDFAGLVEKLSDVCQPGDLIICLGAGSITYWAADLPLALERCISELKRVIV
ncbi:MAG: UDP-N-acetylmuramate--L-alanine ligase [Alphaproteobacteria bacterium]|nr:UDP-N-acetylmuramate--L-alanine ligase [Alphaproteobacteria bacterium]